MFYINDTVLYDLNTFYINKSAYYDTILCFIIMLYIVIFYYMI